MFARFAKRFALLIPGLVIVYLSVHTIFPLFDTRLPLALAILVTYIAGAYLLIPALIRLIRVLAPARHIQAYSVTPDGFASDPVNIGIVGTDRELLAAMRSIGWEVADPHTPRYLLRAIASTIFNRPYPTAPMSNLYLFGRKQDIGFEKIIKGERGHRHHVRFWAATYRDGTDLSTGKINWHQHRARRQSGAALWVGAASRDIGLAFIMHNVQVTHMIHPDTNVERELIIGGLKRAGLVAATESIRLRRPYRLPNRAWGGSLDSDGRLIIVKLKSQAASSK